MLWRKNSIDVVSFFIETCSTYSQIGAGLRVFATSRDVGSMASLKSANIETLPLDITDTNSIREAKTVIQERTGGTLDILVNNA